MRRVVVLVLAASLVLVSVAAASGAVMGVPGGPNPPQPLTTFPKGSFPESLAVRGGHLYVSLGFLGQVVKVTAAGDQTLFTNVPRGDDGLLTGLAFDGAGNLYVGAATFADDPAPGVFQIAPDRTVTRVLTLPSSSFPNGLAFHDGYLYVSDSAQGAIWRVQPGGPSPSAPWYQDPLLAPSKFIGANGIAFDASGHLYVVVADSGRVVRLTLTGNGSAVSDATVVTEREQLRSADGIAFDASSNLYIAVNHSNRLYRLALPDGTLTRLADRSDGLSYPTQPAFDTNPGATTLYLTNGALFNGIPGIEAFDFGVGGLPLP